MIYIDTELLRTNGENVVNKANDFRKNIDDIFSNLGKMGDNLGEWTGSSSAKFIKHANNDKLQYLKYANDLISYGNNMKNAAYKIEALCKEVRYK